MASEVISSLIDDRSHSSDHRHTEIAAVESQPGSGRQQTVRPGSGSTNNIGSFVPSKL